MLWRNDSIDKSGQMWSRRVLAREGWTDRFFESLDEAAVTIGTTGKELSNWQRQMLALRVECIELETITYQGKSGHYVQFLFPPPMLRYGFRYAPPSDAIASRALPDGPQYRRLTVC
jgi:hypothetical protein